MDFGCRENLALAVIKNDEEKMNLSDYKFYWRNLVEDQSPDRFKELDKTTTLSEIEKRQNICMAPIYWRNKKIKTISILTELTRSVLEEDKEKLKENEKELERTLRSGHYAWFPIEKNPKQPYEKSYLIFNISRQETNRLGQLYKHYGIVWISICQTFQMPKMISRKSAKHFCSDFHFSMGKQTT